MLQKLNERIQGVVAWVVIVLVAVTFTLFGIDYYIQSRQDAAVQVEVNGQAITKQAFELNYRRTRQMRDPAQMTMARENQLKQQVIDEMIVNSVSMQAARANGFEVNPAQANAAILSIPQFQEDGHFSADRYQQALNGALFTPESFQTEVRQGMLLNQQRFAFMGTAFALPTEIQQFVKLYMQTRDYDYMQIPALRFIKQTNVSSQEIEAYYQQHKKEFLTPELVSVDFIHLSLSEIKAKTHLSQEQVKRYYDENQNNYYSPAQWQVAHILLAASADASVAERHAVKEKAEGIYQLLQKDPHRFDELMNSLSDDKISVKQGGVLPWVVAGQSEFDKALLNLTTPGQILPPVKAKHGYEIFKLLAYKPAEVKPLAEVEAQIREQLLVERAQADYAQALEKLSDLSYQTPDSLTPVGDALKLVVQESPPFSRQGGVSLLTKNKQVINAAFSHDVLDLGNNSEPIPLDNDSVIVLRVRKHIKATEKSLAEMKPIIAEKLSFKKAEAEAHQLGQSLLANYQNTLERDKLIDANHLQWHEVLKSSRDGDTAPSDINEVAFELPREGTELGRVLGSGDFVIVHLKKISDGNIDDLDKEQIASITQQIESSYGMMDYDLYVSGLLKQAKIVKH